MSRLSSIAIATTLLGSPVLGLGGAAAYAHTVQSSGEVAATFHLEPDHNPRAGDPAQVWFALTERGGAIVPLANCDCRLAIYAEPRQAEDTPIATPALTAIAAEQYRDIPGASVVFPKPGRYVLELSGQPAGTATFAPFQFRYSTTVLAATGSASPAPNPVATSFAPPSAHSDRAALPAIDPGERRSAQPIIVVLGSTAIAAIVALGLGLRWLLSRNPATSNPAASNPAVSNPAVKRPPSESERGQF